MCPLIPSLPSLLLTGRLTAASQSALFQSPTRAGRSSLSAISGGGTSALPSRPEWRIYIRGLAAPSGPLSPYLVRQIETLWRALELTVPRAPSPHAAVTVDSGFSMTWDHGRHHFEVEIFSDGRYDWFYMDRESSFRAGEEDRSAMILSPEMATLFKKAVSAE